MKPPTHREPLGDYHRSQSRSIPSTRAKSFLKGRKKICRTTSISPTREKTSSSHPSDRPTGRQADPHAPARPTEFLKGLFLPNPPLYADRLRKFHASCEPMPTKPRHVSGWVKLRKKENSLFSLTLSLYTRCRSILRKKTSPSQQEGVTCHLHP